MLIESDFKLKTLKFDYLNLNKYLYELYEKGINEVNILLLISLEVPYYEGEKLKEILLDLKELSDNLVCEFNGEKIKFRVNKIQIDNGDVLNRHRWIYRYLEEYMLENNLNNEEEVPDYIKKEIEIKAYVSGKKQGFDWFKRNLNSFNLLFPNNVKLNEEFELSDKITEIYTGCEKCPKMEYVCYEYWLEHPDYKIMEKALNDIRNLEHSILENTYKEEAKYYFRRLKKRDLKQYFTEMFIKYSKNYLADETIKHSLIQSKIDNNFEFYFGNEVWHNLTFRSEKAQKNEVIANYLKNELFGLTKSRNVAIKDKQ